MIFITMKTIHKNLFLIKNINTNSNDHSAQKGHNEIHSTNLLSIQRMNCDKRIENYVMMCHEANINTRSSIRDPQRDVT